MARSLLVSHLLRCGVVLSAATVIGAVSGVTADAAVASDPLPLPFSTAELRPGTTDAFVSRSEERAPVDERTATVAIDVAIAERTALLAAVDERVSQAEVDAAALARTSSLAATSAAIEAEQARIASKKFFWPTEGGITSAWGPRLHPILKYTRLHGGADIGGELGAPIFAVADGVVTKAALGHNGGSGNNVRIDHGVLDGEALETSYLHMHEIEVEAGQTVTKGQRIGSVGSTGLSTAPHLHFSVYVNGANSDPAPHLNA